MTVANNAGRIMLMDPAASPTAITLPAIFQQQMEQTQDQEQIQIMRAQLELLLKFFLQMILLVQFKLQTQQIHLLV